MNLMEAFKVYSDIAKPIIIKSDMLRLGIRYSQRALESLKQRDDIIVKGYHMFSFDVDKPVMLQEKIPYELFLDDGTELGMIVQARIAGDSPYLVDLVDGDYKLFWNGEEVAKISRFNTKAKFNYRCLKDGTPFEAYVRKVGEDLLFITANKFCEYFAKDMQCLFCDLTTFAAEQKKAGEAMILRKQAEITAEILDVALHEPGFRYIWISGGSFFSEYQGKPEVEWYCEFLHTIRKRIKCWYSATLQVTALDDEGWKRLYDTGIPTIAPNIEVWDKRLFEIICPGKNWYVGYDEWIKRTINAVKYWGEGNVNPSFVPGVEMAQPFGFKKVEDAIKSMLEGYDFLMSNGVLPRQGSFWVREDDSKLAGQLPPPLEYFIEIGKGYLELREKHGFLNPVPTLCRTCGNHGTEFDFDYFHGHTAASKQAEETSHTGR